MEILTCDYVSVCHDFHLLLLAFRLHNTQHGTSVAFVCIIVHPHVTVPSSDHHLVKLGMPQTTDNTL